MWRMQQKTRVRAYHQAKYVATMQMEMDSSQLSGMHRDRLSRPGAPKDPRVQEMESMTMTKSHQFQAWGNRGTQECWNCALCDWRSMESKGSWGTAL